MYTFYRNNRTDEEYELTEDQLRDYYNTWMRSKHLQWIEYYWLRLDDLFVMEFLESVSEPKQVRGLRHTLSDIRVDIWNQLNAEKQ